MVDRGFHFGGPRFFLKILVDRGLVDRGSEKLSTTLVTGGVEDQWQRCKRRESSYASRLPALQGRV